jgi:hypothetical protein
MKKWVISLLLLGGVGTSVLADSHSDTNERDQVAFTVSAEEWVSTSSARLVVSVHATLDSKGLAGARNAIMDNLQKISAGEWHITSFNRNQDSSGLEQLTAQAEARIPEKELTNVRDAAKGVSKPGATYIIDNIDFTPTLAEYEQSRAKLRELLYNKVKAELGRLNSVYPEAHFTVQRIDFNPTLTATEEPRAEQQPMNLKAAGYEAPPTLNVTERLTQSAWVSLATVSNAKS